MRSLVQHRPPFVAVGAAIIGSALFAGSPTLASADRIRSAGDLVSYSPAVPEGARARVDAVYTSAGDSIVTLDVWGLEADTAYGAHAHAKPCGSTGAAAGPHFQNIPDPTEPSTDPAFANPVNEIWLDLTTDAAGNGVAQTKVPWQFSPQSQARSVIIHAEHTRTGATDSGVAGPRLACLTVGF
jgi:Cu-Zn family superoxide dismutase